MHVTADGTGIVWWLDPLGDERGRWMVSPFEGGEAAPLFPGRARRVDVGSVPRAPTQSRRGSRPTMGTWPWSSRDGDPAHEIYRHARPAGVGREWPQGPGGLSADGALLAIRHSERSDISNQAVRDRSTPARAMRWPSSPTTGRPGRAGRLVPDRRRPATRRASARSGASNVPGCGTPSKGHRRRSPVELPGAVTLTDWYPDASALLLRLDHEAVHSLHRHDLGGGTTTRITVTGGTISGGGVRPDASVWLRREDGRRAPVWTGVDDVAVVAPPGDPAPAGRPWEALWFDNPTGDRIQGWLMRARRPGAVPHDRLRPRRARAITTPTRSSPDVRRSPTRATRCCMVNYRGSTGYGAAFRKALDRNIGFPESEDLNAGLDHLIAAGIVDPVTGRAGGLVVGRLSRHAERGSSPRPLGLRDRGDPGGRFGGRALRVRPGPARLGSSRSWGAHRWRCPSCIASGTR